MRWIPGVALLLAAAAAGTAARTGGDPARPEAPAPLLVPDRIKADTAVILAHPDDEGVVAPLLARWALVEKQRVVNIYLTSGELGTDRVGSVRGPSFGYMRLTELHWTLDHLGVRMFHALGRADLRSPDDPDLVLRSWDRERTVRELARYLRLLRPDRLLTWVPGPASGHPAHMAAGAAALFACRAAAEASAFPEQMETEGLRAYAVPSVLLFAQAEKVSYERYPVEAASALPAGVRVEEVAVDGYDATLRRRYCDLAREALKEQRSAGMGAGLERGGPFDEPLRLIHALEEPAVPEGLAGVSLRLKAAGSQSFFEAVAREAGTPGILRAFRPEALIGANGSGCISLRLVNRGAARVDGGAAIALPEGWAALPARLPVALDGGEAADLDWKIEGPSAPDLAYAVADVVVTGGGKKGRELARLSLVIKRPRAPVEGRAP